MNRKFDALNKALGAKIGMGVSLILLMALASQLPWGKWSRRYLASRGLPYSFSEVVTIYEKAWISFEEKARAIREIHQDNEILRAENTELKLQLSQLQFGCRSKEAKAATEKNEGLLSKETGIKTGLTLASISYKVPKDFLPLQLYTLGITYFDAREDEKAAVIFTTLANLEETSAYRTAKHLMTTGIAWFRVENYSLADMYFNEVLKKPEDPTTLQFQAQTRLWKALVAKKLNKELKSQYWLKELVDHHPHAPETAWVNPVGRGE